MRFDTVGTDGNHAHLFVDAAPKYSSFDIFRIVKSITAVRMFEKPPEIKKNLWGGEFWNDGGYVGTVGEGTTADVVRRYILRQGKKDDKHDFKQFKLFPVR
jgi:putative transposase